MLDSFFKKASNMAGIWVLIISSRPHLEMQQISVTFLFL